MGNIKASARMGSGGCAGRARAGGMNESGTIRNGLVFQAPAGDEFGTVWILVIEKKRRVSWRKKKTDRERARGCRYWY